jgi:hypothetical protein
MSTSYRPDCGFGDGSCDCTVTWKEGKKYVVHGDSCKSFEEYVVGQLKELRSAISNLQGGLAP